MKMHYLIDGYNLIHRIDSYRSKLGKSLEEARQTLLIQLSSFRAASGSEITIVFDGAASGGSLRSGISILFSNLPNKADELIKRMVDQNKSKQSLTVVSSDREVTWYAKGCGCSIMTAESFYQKMKTRKSEASASDLQEKSDPQLSPREISEWMKIFKGDA